jgi:hypothetical protein
MNILRISLLTVTLLLQFVSVAQSATFAVLPGTSIQAQIDLAADGDIVAIFGGIYDQNVMVNKRIRLVEVSGEDVIINGDVTFTGVVDCPPFEGFTVGIPGKKINVTNTTGLLFRAIDNRQGDAVIISGASSILKIDSCQLNNLTAQAGLTEISNSSLMGSISQTGGNLHAVAVTVAGSFSTSGTANRTIAFRTTVTGDCSWVSNRSWFGYGKMQSFSFIGSNAKIVLVANEINRSGGEASAVTFGGVNNKVQVVNCWIHNVTALYGNYNPYNGYPSNTSREFAFWVKSGSASKCYIYNCLISMNTVEGNNHAGIKAESPQVIIRNNILIGCKTSIDAPFGATVEYNILQNSSIPGGGVLDKNTTTTTSARISGPISSGALDLDSPCIDAGSTDFKYVDRDGTRNDIGPFGGSWYDPEAWTSTKPVLISFDLAPEIVLQGVDSDVTLDEIVAVSAP